MSRALPHTDESIRAVMHSIWQDAGHDRQWRAGNTVVNGLFFGAFVRHANEYWFDKPHSFEHTTDVTTVDDLVAQLRKHEKELVSA